MVTTQYLSYQTFSEKLNSLIVTLSELNKTQTIEEFMLRLSHSIKALFSAEILRLWMADGNTGIFYSIVSMENNRYLQIRCYQTKGLMGKAISTGLNID